jgi:hypothetical protein
MGRDHLALAYTRRHNGARSQLRPRNHESDPGRPHHRAAFPMARRRSPRGRRAAAEPSGMTSAQGEKRSRLFRVNGVAVAIAATAVRPEQQRVASTDSQRCSCIHANGKRVEVQRMRPLTVLCGASQTPSRDAPLAREAAVAFLVEHEGENDDDDEDALDRVHNDPHPGALEPP